MLLNRAYLSPASMNVNLSFTKTVTVAPKVVGQPEPVPVVRQ